MVFFFVGLCHQLGKGATKDLTKALGYYRRVSNVSTTNKMNWIQERTRFRAIEIYMENSNTYSLAWEQLLVTKTHFSIMNHQCKSSRTLARTARFYIGNSPNSGPDSCKLTLYFFPRLLASSLG
jgi:hypothetical protein